MTYTAYETDFWADYQLTDSDLEWWETNDTLAVEDAMSADEWERVCCEEEEQEELYWGE